MTVDINNPYFRTRVLTAKPEELRLMLIEGCLRFLRQGRDGLSSRDYEKSFEGFSNARNIILELMSSLRHDIAPEICANLDALYNYMFRRLTEGSFEKDLAKVDEVISLMEYERETWLMLMDRLAKERGGSPAGAGAPDAAGEPARRSALSLQA